MKCMERIVGKIRRDSVRNERIQREIKQKKTLVSLVEKCELKLCGHVRRMEKERKAKQVFKMRTEGKFGHDRPRIIWEDNIKKLGQKRGNEGHRRRHLIGEDGLNMTTQSSKRQKGFE